MIRRNAIRVLLLLLSFNACSAAQSSVPDPQVLLQRVAQSMKRYARDISEIPIQVSVTTSHYDQHGTLKKQRITSHSMQYVKRFVSGDRVVRDLTWKRSLFRGVTTEEANADSATSLFALLFDNGQTDNSHTYSLISHPSNNTLHVHIGHRIGCEPFNPMDVKQRLWCGEADLQLAADSLVPLRGSFDESGLPHDFDGTVFRSFHFDEEFQFVSVEGSREPLLLPAKVVVEVQTDRGKTRVESRYSVAPRPIH